MSKRNKTSKGKYDLRKCSKDQERARRRRQIEKGILRKENGLKE